MVHSGDSHEEKHPEKSGKHSISDTRYMEYEFKSRVQWLQSIGVKFLTGPATVFHENFVVPLRRWWGAHPVYYHRQVRRVPTLDECYTDDPVCIQEANLQFQRDRLVDKEILKILYNRYRNCLIHETKGDGKVQCKVLEDAFNEADTNFFVKYGDLRQNAPVLEAYMKQKHRLIWERRHGPVGSGTKKSGEVEAE